MPSGSPLTGDWNVALAEFLTWYAAHRAEKAARFYRTQLTQLIRWAEGKGIAFGAFGKRHVDRYLVARAKAVSRMPLHSDGVTAKAFFK